jgi:hypothetical protein
VRDVHRNVELVVADLTARGADPARIARLQVLRTR